MTETSAPSAQDQAEIEKNIGNDFFKEKNFTEAIKHYNEAIKLNPDNAVFYSNRSACYASLQDWQLALDDALECVAKDPKFVKGYYRLALAQIELKLFDDAETTIKQGEALDSDNDQFPKLRKQIKSKRQALAQSKKGIRQMDEQQKKEFLELQEQLSTFSRDMRTVQAKLANAQREERANQVTLSHIRSLDDNVQTYRATGKAFLLTPKPEIEERLEKEYSTLIKLQRDLLDRKEYLERRITSTSSNIKDITNGA